jgi:hypothetical protein
MVEDLIKRLNRYVESLAPPMSKRYIGEAIDLLEQQAARITSLESERDALLAAAGKEAVASSCESCDGERLIGSHACPDCHPAQAAQSVEPDERAAKPGLEDYLKETERMERVMKALDRVTYKPGTEK